MSWNYRIIKHVNKNETYYAIHEVYYKPTGWTKKPTSLYGESPEALKNILAMIKQAFARPILVDEQYSRRINAAEKSV